MTVLPAPQRSLGSRLGAYLALTKPRIIELLLITTVPAMILAGNGWPGTGLLVGTVIGGALSAGGANAINNVVDRDIDAHMRRTRHRPLPTHSATPGEALLLGSLLGIAGFAVLWSTANMAAAALATTALAFYVLVYSLYLKRATPQNIVIGGAAGAIPAVVGWAAVTGSLALPAWLMFAIVFYWTPPHFWALALRYKQDYERAGVPMLPVVAGERATAVQILVYSFVVTGSTLLLQPAAGLGPLYMSLAVAMGVSYVVACSVLLKRIDAAMRVFRFSNIYLAALFAAIALDVLSGAPVEPSAAAAWSGAFLVVAGSLTIVAITRPKSLREFAFVLVPAAGAVIASIAVLGRL